MSACSRSRKRSAFVSVGPWGPTLRGDHAIVYAVEEPEEAHEIMASQHELEASIVHAFRRDIDAAYDQLLRAAGVLP